MTSNIQAKLSADKTIDYIATLGAQFALDAGKAVQSAGSSAKVGTFDTNEELIKAIKDGSVTFADRPAALPAGLPGRRQLWLYKTNGNTIGGGQNVATGPGLHRQVQRRRRRSLRSQRHSVTDHEYRYHYSSGGGRG